MKMKWIAALGLSAVLLGSLAGAAQARDRDWYDRYDRAYDRDLDYRYDTYSNRTYDNSRYRHYRTLPNGERRQKLADRADRMAANIEARYREGRLSREHRDRALAKLERVRRDVNDRRTIDQERFDADQQWMDSIHDDVQNWLRR